MSEENNLIDPLSDSRKSAVYFDITRPVDDPEREAIQVEVTRYFEARYPEKEEVLDVPGSVIQQPTKSDRPAGDIEQAGSSSRFDLEGYEPLLTPEMGREMTPFLNEAASAYGDIGQQATWIAFCEANGMTDAARALERLTAIQTEHSDWKSSPVLRAEVIRLNHVLESAALGWYSRNYRAIGMQDFNLSHWQ